MAESTSRDTTRAIAMVVPTAIAVIAAGVLAFLLVQARGKVSALENERSFFCSGMYSQIDRLSNELVSLAPPRQLHTGDLRAALVYCAEDELADEIGLRLQEARGLVIAGELQAAAEELKRLRDTLDDAKLHD